MFTIAAGVTLMLTVAGTADLLRFPERVTSTSVFVVVLAVCIALAFAYAAHLRGE